MIQAPSPTSKPRNSYELVGRRLQRIIASPRVQRIQLVEVSRLDDESPEAWHQVIQDIEDAAKDVSPARQAPPKSDAKPAYPDELLAENIEKWQPLIDAGRTSPEHIISNVISKYSLRDDQIETITNLKALDGDAA